MEKVKIEIPAHAVKPFAQLLSGWAQSAPFLDSFEVAAVVSGEVAAKLLPKTLYGGDVKLKLTFAEALAVYVLLTKPETEVTTMVRSIIAQIEKFVIRQRGLRETACWEMLEGEHKALNSWV